MRNYVSTYLSAEKEEKYPIVYNMTESGWYSPEVCEAVYLALEDYYKAEQEAGQPLTATERRQILTDSADSYVCSNIKEEDIYSHAEEADEMGREAIYDTADSLGNGITRIADIIYDALSLLIMHKAESHFAENEE